MLAPAQTREERRGVMDVHGDLFTEDGDEADLRRVMERHLDVGRLQVGLRLGLRLRLGRGRGHSWSGCCRCL